VALPDLVTRLCEHAGGVYAYRAAVELLVDHGVFLGRSGFCDEFVRFTPAGAYVRWGAVVTALNQYRLVCSTSEDGIARIAASLGGDVPVRLGRVLGGFDAAKHRAGSRRGLRGQSRSAASLPRRRRGNERAVMNTDLGFGSGPPRVRLWPVRGQPGLSPALMCDDLLPGQAATDGGVLACPWCGLSSNLRLAGVYFATPGPGRYWPSFGVDIDVMAAMVTLPGVAATDLHAEASNGVMLAVECWCANGAGAASNCASTPTRAKTWTWWCSAWCNCPASRPTSSTPMMSTPTRSRRSDGFSDT
jgi:hypothetical protein